MARLISIFSILAFVLGVVLGGGVIYYIYKPKPVKIAPYATKETRNPDQSLTLESKPMQEKDLPEKPVVPKGEKLLRYISVTVHDTLRDTVSLVIMGQETTIACPPCPDIKVNLSLTEGNDFQHVTAQTPDGYVLTGIDIPVVNRQTFQKQKTRAFGLLGEYEFNRTRGRIGFFVEKKFGPLTLEAHGTSSLKTFEPILGGGLGVNF